MKDEAGADEKLLVVPNSKITPLYKDVETIRQMPPPELDRIAHFFEHYKDLEKGKWVKIEGWDGPKDAKRVILESIERFNKAPSTPNF
jgi:inorganic pyrophosphatase